MNWLQKISESEQPYVYHAQTHVVPGVLNPRDAKTYNSIGTWFTSSPEEASRLYGKNVTKYQLPAGNYTDFSCKEFETAFADDELIRKHFGNDVANQLQRFPWDKKNRQRKRELHLRMDDSLLTPKEEMEYRSLVKSDKLLRSILTNKEYIRDLRQKYLSQGSNGFVWRNSTIDNPVSPHDVYVSFHKDDIHPLP